MGVFLKEGFDLGLAGIGMNVGIGLTLMGVSEMLFPLPKPHKILVTKKIHAYHLVFLECKIHHEQVLATLLCMEKLLLAQS